MSELRPLQSKEVRIIKVGHEAELELLWEALMEYGNASFGIPDEDDENIFMMKYNEITHNIVFAVCKLADYKRIDLDVIDQTTKITANSMFDNMPYIVEHLPEDDINE